MPRYSHFSAGVFPPERTPHPPIATCRRDSCPAVPSAANPIELARIIIYRGTGSPRFLSKRMSCSAVSTRTIVGAPQDFRTF